MAGRTKDRERDGWQQRGVEPEDQRRSGDARITQHLRDVHRRQCQAGKYVAYRQLAVEGPKASKEPEWHCRLSQGWAARHASGHGRWLPVKPIFEYTHRTG